MSSAYLLIMVVPIDKTTHLVLTRSKPIIDMHISMLIRVQGTWCEISPDSIILHPNRQLVVYASGKPY